MTPEEILAECPELLRINDVYFMVDGDEDVPDKVATAWALSRKEARELRELLQLILPTLYGENYMLVSKLLKKHRSTHD